MKSTITWTDNRTFEGKTEDGFRVTFGQGAGDGPKPGPSAMELLLIGAGGCSAFDVVSVLEKGRQDIDDVIVELDADRAGEVPRVFTRIHMHFVVKGRNVSEAKVARAIDLSVDKYCSATRMLEKTATVTHDFEIIEV